MAVTHYKKKTHEKMITIVTLPLISISLSLSPFHPNELDTRISLISSGNKGKPVTHYTTTEIANMIIIVLRPAIGDILSANLDHHRQHIICARSVVGILNLRPMVSSKIFLQTPGYRVPIGY